MQTTPHTNIPAHVAIIMDGNGRWAQKQNLPRHCGHEQGVRAAREVVERCANLSVKTLTLFAFSSENINRPSTEVDFLMTLLRDSLSDELAQLIDNNIRLRFIGDRARFDETMEGVIDRAEQLTKHNTGMTLVIALHYGGRWDIVQATAALCEKVKTGFLNSSDIDEALFQSHLSTSNLPEPDLFIRTSGTSRVSNFLLWQLAYTELVFIDKLWPDFDNADLDAAINQYAMQNRKFGLTQEQVEASSC